MNNSHYIGRRVSSFELYGEIGPITGVALLLDDENELLAGDDSGYMIEVSCPYGTQAMADNILASLKEKTYKGFRAESAPLSPTAELGDEVNVNGIASVLAHRAVTFGPGHMSEIAAPGENELEHEYSWKSPEKKEFERKLAQTRSLISKTAEQIRLEVQGVDERVSAIDVSLEEITLVVAGLDGAMSSIEQKMDSIELSVSSADGSTTFKLLSDGAELSAKTLNLSVDAVNVTGKVTADQIDASKLKVKAANITGTLTAEELIGETVALLDANGEEAGWITIGDASSSDYRVELKSGGALYLSSADGAVWLESPYNSLGLSLDGVTVDDHFYPQADGVYDLGDGDFRWSNIYAETDEINTSDRNEKHDIRYDMERFDVFFDGLMPVVFKFNKGTSNRDHVGLVAQDVEDNLTACDLTGTDFAGFVKFEKKDGSYGYGLRYGEFIGLLIDQVQRLKIRVAELEGKNNEV